MSAAFPNLNTCMTWLSTEHASDNRDRIDCACGFSVERCAEHGGGSEAARIFSAHAKTCPVDRNWVPPAKAETHDDGWMQTASGLQAYILKPNPIIVRVEDIAHHLALQCRYAGATRDFYSVAQHCVIASEEVERELRERVFQNCAPGDSVDLVESRAVAFLALLHDAAEAYVQDIIRPLKRHLQPCYGEIEDGWAKAIAVKFGLPRAALIDLPPIVKEADQRMCSTEKRDLMSIPPSAWSTDRWPPYDRKIEPWPWEKARREFLRRFEDLGGRR